MDDALIDARLNFLRGCERLKDVLRSGHTSGGRRESTAEHSWRLALMAMVLMDQLGEVDRGRVLELCLVHDLGEALGGDVPAPEQVRAAARMPSSDATCCASAKRSMRRCARGSSRCGTSMRGRPRRKRAR